MPLLALPRRSRPPPAETVLPMLLGSLAPLAMPSAARYASSRACRAAAFRAIVVLTDDGYSQEEIGEALGISERAVEGRLYRLRQKDIANG